MRAMVDGGCDVIEVGLPYSDPVMDGPTIQAAAQQGARGGVRTTDVLRTVEAVAETGAKVVVMTYWNGQRYGVERFTPSWPPPAAQDSSPRTSSPTRPPSGRGGRRPRPRQIFLIAPSSTDRRLAMTVEACRNFVYATAVMGVTGARESTSDLAGPLVKRARGAADLPIAVGLGVSNGRQAAGRRVRADGVIVGSAFVRRLPRPRTPPRASSRCARAEDSRQGSGVVEPAGTAPRRSVRRPPSPPYSPWPAAPTETPGTVSSFTEANPDSMQAPSSPSSTRCRTSRSPPPTGSRTH